MEVVIPYTQTIHTSFRVVMTKMIVINHSILLLSITPIIDINGYYKKIRYERLIACLSYLIRIPNIIL